MAVLSRILQLILALSTLILIHELGHFLFAKLFKMRVDKFFLFFDVKGIKILSTKQGWFSRLFPSLKNKDTEYGIGWLPLGGYCKINGMIDESLDTESLKNDIKEWEFRAKPAWQRLLVMAGGILFNLILAILLYISIACVWGEKYIKNEGSHIYVNSLAYDLGFRTGDQILDYDGIVPQDFSMLQAELARQKVSKVRILRNNKDTLNLYMDQNKIAEVLKTPLMFNLALPFIIDSIPNSSINFNTDLKIGDQIIEINKQTTPYIQDISPILEKNSNSIVEVLVKRDLDSLRLNLKVDSLGHLGVFIKRPQIESKNYSLIASIPAGLSLTIKTIRAYVQDLSLVFTPQTKAYKSVGSFISMGRIFPEFWNWYRFINILALLSIMLAVMNLLPIPGLDGGHILFTLFEIFTGKKPSDRFLLVSQMIGMVILLSLMVLALSNDIISLF